MCTDRYNVEAPLLDWSVETLTDKHKLLLQSCNKYKKEHAVTHYDFLAANYEGMYLKCGYPDPKYVANYVAKFAEKSKQKPSDVKILDLACGTGLVGKALAEHGFT